MWGHFVDQVSGGTMPPQQQLIARLEREFPEQELTERESAEQGFTGRRDTPPDWPDRTGGTRRQHPHRKAWYITGACAIALAVGGTVGCALAWFGPGSPAGHSPGHGATTASQPQQSSRARLQPSPEPQPSPTAIRLLWPSSGGPYASTPPDLTTIAPTPAFSTPAPSWSYPDPSFRPNPTPSGPTPSDPTSPPASGPTSPNPTPSGPTPSDPTSPSATAPTSPAPTPDPTGPASG